MRKRKPTFTDPRTGEEIESTVLARWGAGSVIGLVIGLIIGLFNGVQIGQFGGGLAWVLYSVLFYMLFCGLVTGLLTGLSGGLGDRRGKPWVLWTHDHIARWQHSRRQRLLRPREFPHVPDGALSRADPPGEPEPTQASLSLAERPEEDAPRLTASAEAETEAEEQVVKEKT